MDREATDAPSPVSGRGMRHVRPHRPRLRRRRRELRETHELVERSAAAVPCRQPSGMAYRVPDGTPPGLRGVTYFDGHWFNCIGRISESA
jgi:hypothetical protein